MTIDYASLTPFLVAAFASLSGLIINFIEFQKRPKEELPDTRSGWYWLPYVFYPILAVFLVFVYSEAAAPMGKLAAAHIGASTPLSFRAISSVDLGKKGIDLQPGA